MVKGKGNMKCYWVNEGGQATNFPSVLSAVERVRAQQKLKIMKTSMEAWKTEALPEQALDKSEDFKDLEGNLRNRLNKHASGSTTD